MVIFYLDQIRRGLMTVDEVPRLWNKKVKKELENLEADKEGKEN